MTVETIIHMPLPLNRTVEGLSLKLLQNVYTYCNGFDQIIAMQRLDTHLAIRSRNNKGMSSLLSSECGQQY
jgi:hypothetical protein